MSRQQYRFHGDPMRFEVVADFIVNKYGKSVTYIADVAGGQGMLTKLLCKKFNYKSEVIDPRGWTIKGIPSKEEKFVASMATYYDLIVGLHPDEAIRDVANAALVRPTILIPCCNFWSEQKLSREELLGSVEAFYTQNGVNFERIVFGFKGPKNIGLVSKPSKHNRL